MNDQTLISMLLTIAVACAAAQVLIILIGVTSRIIGAIQDWKDAKRRSEHYAVDERLNELRRLKVQAFRDWEIVNIWLMSDYGVKTLTELEPKHYTEAKKVLEHIIHRNPEHDYKKLKTN